MSATQPGNSRRVGIPIKEGAMSQLSKFRFVHESPREEKTMKRLSNLGVVVLAAITAMFAFALPASADTTCSTDSNGTETCTTFSPPSVAQATDQESDSAYAASRNSLNQIILVYTHFSFNEKKAKAQHRCFWVKTAYNGGYWAGHSGFWYQKDHNLHVCKSSASPTGYIKIGGGMTGADCHNPIKLLKSPPPARRIITAKVQWASHFIFKAAVSVTSKSTSSVSVSVQQHNADNTCQASASARAGGLGQASAKAVAYGNTKVSAVTNAKNSILSQLHTKVQTLAAANATSNASSWAEAEVLCSPSQPPPPSQSILITSLTQLNQIPAGMSSGEFNVTVHASDAGGELTVDPGIGAVSDCSGGALQSDMTFTGLAAGDNTLCLQLWAPNDASQPSSMTATFTAILGSASDVKSETFAITYPTRP